MSEYVIMTDNMGDLPASFYEEHQIPVMYLSYTMDGETYGEGHMQSDHLADQSAERKGTISQSAEYWQGCAVHLFFLRAQRHI